MHKASVFRDRNMIMPHYVPEELPFREKQIRQTGKVLAVALDGKKPDNLFVYGKVGTGKTATLKNVLKQLGEVVEKGGAPIDRTYINCRNHNSKYKVMIKAVKQYFPGQNFLGFSIGFVHDKLLEYANKGRHLVLVLDEIDKVKDVDELVYALTRSNDELEKGSVSIAGISNNLMFKERLDPRTKSSLCEKELVFPPYNAEELKAILKQRVELGFKENSVNESALSLAAAYSAKESGDARTAVMLLLRAGELADEEKKGTVSEKEVEKAKSRVEEEIIFNMVSTLPEQQQLVLKAVAELTLSRRGVRKITGASEEGVFYSGDIFEKYQAIARGMQKDVVTARWYRQYISELETYGLLLTTSSGKGIRGQTRLIKLGFDARGINQVIDKELGLRIA